MIIVSVEVPMMDATYDFQVDEDVILGVVLDEITDMICQKNQCETAGDVSRLGLWDTRRHTLLNPNATAYENGLISGSELLLA